MALQMTFFTYLLDMIFVFAKCTVGIQFVWFRKKGILILFGANLEVVFVWRQIGGSICLAPDMQISRLAPDIGTYMRQIRRQYFLVLIMRSL